ncbi:hypothetical protein PK98_05195 [Croceibacterium mercuriale]|uniref:Uncharacterized protein n=1 Tax=Croceibacterium mercuriale TaxID=1572751 RepID=A0A0B2BX02_9SPHN|nr:hypothetical protein PK98_05195 [Croceibacterium mercuriale]
MYSGGLYDAPDQLDTFWPLLVGLSLLFPILFFFNLPSPWRWIVGIALAGPGFVWAGLLLFHEVRSLPGRARRHDTVSKQRE